MAYQKDIFDSFLDADRDEERAASVAAAEAIKDICPCCGEESGDYEVDEYRSCRTCGTVIDKILDSVAEYRYFQQDSGADPCRVGAPQDPRLPESSLGTIILGGYGKAMYRIRKYHTWNMLPYKERSMLQIYERLNILATNHGLSANVLDFTKNLFQQMNEVCDRRGLNRDSVLASCLYTALKHNGSPRKPKEVSDMFGLTGAAFTRSLKNFQESMMLAGQKGRLTAGKKEIVHIQSTCAKDYVGLPLSRLPISRAEENLVRRIAEHLCAVAEDQCMSSENMPTSLAAGVLAWTLRGYRKIDIGLPVIAEACGISVATLQKCLRRLAVWEESLVAEAATIK
jgi:transcription initiation factor TFIIIB Brf1 subunit/transcription initiation factor TFIIB